MEERFCGECCMPIDPDCESPLCGVELTPGQVYEFTGIEIRNTADLRAWLEPYGIEVPDIIEGDV